MDGWMESVRQLQECTVIDKQTGCEPKLPFITKSEWKMTHPKLKHQWWSEADMEVHWALKCPYLFSAEVLKQKMQIHREPHSCLSVCHAEEVAWFYNACVKSQQQWQSPGTCCRDQGHGMQTNSTVQEGDCTPFCSLSGSTRINVARANIRIRNV